MRGSIFALLVLSIAFIATTNNAAAAKMESATSVLPRTRLLRSVKAAAFEGVQDERSGLAMAAEKATSSWTKLKNKALVTLGKKTFKTYNLRGAQLEDNKNFLKWLNAMGKKVGSDPDRLAPQVIDVLREEGKKYGGELAALSIWLRGVQNKKDLAESMQRYLSLYYPTSGAALIDAWAKSRVKPEKIYKRLRVDTIESTNTAFRQWLAYIQKLDDSAFYQQALSLMKAKQPSDLKLATVLQSIKGRPELELEKIAEKLQTDLFKTMIARNVKPSDFNKMRNGHTILENELLRLPLAKYEHRFAADPYYHSLRKYTLRYAEAKGVNVEKVKYLFTSNKPEFALEEAAKKAT